MIPLFIISPKGGGQEFPYIFFPMVKPTERNVFGWKGLSFWTATNVSFKTYLCVIMQNIKEKSCNPEPGK